MSIYDNMHKHSYPKYERIKWELEKISDNETKLIQKSYKCIKMKFNPDECVLQKEEIKDLNLSKF